MTRRLLVAPTVLVALLTTAACSSGDYSATPVPTATSTTPVTASPPGSTTCTPGAVTSYQALPTLDTSQVPASVRKRGVLRVGVSADSLLLSSRNPITGVIEGFDIDIATAVAKAALGPEGEVQLVVITAGQRLAALTPAADGTTQVDMVARNMTMTCDRWTTIAFSAEYYQSGLSLMVPRPPDPKATATATFASLRGKKVCAPNGSTTIDAVRARPGIEAVGADTHTGCLVLFQAGKVDAIAGDDTVLAGLAAQDPYAVVPKQPLLTSEPYGLGFPQGEVGFVRFVNRLLDEMKADGRWKTIYDRWFATSLGTAPAPPRSVYGR